MCIDKWFWKIDYCYKHGLPPAQKWAWDRAEEEWFKHLQIEKEMIDENRYV